MGLWNFLKDASESIDKRADEREKKNKEKREKQYDIDNEKYRLTCKKCNKIAKPVIYTDNNYVCISCGYRFTSVKHPYNSDF